MADKGKRMIFEDEYQYLKDLKENHEDPTAPWDGGSSEPYIINTRAIDASHDTISQEDWEYMLENPDNVIVFRGDQRELYKYGFDSRVRYPEDPPVIRFYNIAPNTNGSRATLEFTGAGQNKTTWNRTYLNIFDILNNSSGSPTTAGNYVIKCSVTKDGYITQRTFEWAEATPSVYRYKIMAGFNWQTMQGTSYYTVYFNLDTTTDYGATLTFDQMRSIIDNQDWVTIDKTISTGELNFYQAYADTDQGDDIIVFEADDLSTQVSFDSLTWFDYLNIQKVTL